MSEARTYTGGCHCGTVRFEVTSALEPVLSCNCSMCHKRGALWTYVAPEEFKLISGDTGMTDYQFNTRTIHHLFCATCGIASFGRGRGKDGIEGVAVNVRCLDDVDIASLTLTPYDGRSR